MPQLKQEPYTSMQTEIKVIIAEMTFIKRVLP